MSYTRLKEKLETILTLPELPFEEDLTAVECKQMYDILCKIEQGTLIELPCKVGDKMYKLCSVNSNIKMGQMWDGKIVKTNCNRCSYEHCPCYDIGVREQDKPYFIHVVEERNMYNLEILVKILPYVGTIWFKTREEAEKRLKELQNG